MVARLQELQPGLLRNWGMQQLGSTLDNQLATAWARRTNGYQPSQAQATQWHYSIHEFLDLAAHLGSEPWYVIPPTFSPDELQHLVAYLAAPAGADEYADLRATLGQTEPWTTVFSAIHLEFGNEMWGGFGSPFLGAVAGGGVRLGGLAHNRFDLIRNSPFFDEDKFDLLIGSQAANFAQTQRIEANSSAHDAIALAPYFYMNNQPEVWSTEEELYYPLFALPWQDVQGDGRMGAVQDHLNGMGQGTALAVYEINFHTTSGTLPIDIRNDLVTSLGGGLALPLFMLTYQRELGIREQNIWRLAAFSNPVVGQNEEDVRLFGALRDLEATGYKRPTFLGAEMANLAIRSDLLETQMANVPVRSIQPPINELTGSTPITLALIQAFAYREGNEYATLLFNLDLTTAHTVTLQLPDIPQTSATLHTLTADSIHADNEESEQVTIQTQQLEDFGQSYDLILAPHSAYVLVWQTDAPHHTVYLSLVID